MIQPPNGILTHLEAKRATSDAGLFRRICEHAKIDRALRLLEKTWGHR